MSVCIAKHCECSSMFISLPVPPANDSTSIIVTPYVVTKYNKNSSHLIVIGVLLALVIPLLAVGRYLYKKRRQREAKAMRIQLRDEFLEEGYDVYFFFFFFFLQTLSQCLNLANLELKKKRSEIESFLCPLKIIV